MNDTEEYLSNLFELALWAGSVILLIPAEDQDTCRARQE